MMNSSMAPNSRGRAAILLSQAERDHAVEQLQAHAVAGRLDFDQLSERTRLAWAAKTRGDLAVAMAGLPGSPVTSIDPQVAAQPSSVNVGGSRSWVVSVLSSINRRGAWRLKQNTHALAILGSCDIDLSQVTTEVEIPQITVFALMGSITITVPEGVSVDVEGLPVLGSFDCHVRDMPIGPDTPVARVRIMGVALLGSVVVKTKTNPNRLMDTRRGRLL